MKNKLLLTLSKTLSVATLLVLAACGTTPETETVEPTDKPETGSLLAVETDYNVYSLDFSSEAIVTLTVDEPDAVFDYDTASDKCAVAIAGVDYGTAPSSLVVRKIVKSAEAGKYLVTIARNGSADHYKVDATIALKSADTTIYTEPFRVLGADLYQGIRSFGFTVKQNPQLKNDMDLRADESGFNYSAKTDSYLDNMILTATFDCESIVTVNGVAQQSGVTANDFNQEVEYVIRTNTSTLTYRVRVKNFTALPIISITTGDGRGITSKDVWKEGTVTINGKGRFDDLEEKDIEIRGRGNTTWGWPKKPYVFKFKKRTAVLGMPEHKRWVLLSNAMDRTMIRNKVAFHIAEQTSLAWTPRCEFVELFINGTHQGTYLLTEQVRVDKNRVDITEMTTDDNSGSAVSGGYLFEMDFHFDNQWQWRTPHNLPIAIKYPDEEDLTTAQYEWAKAYIAEADAAVHSTNMTDAETGYKKYFDIQSFVDYWLIYEICINHEIGNPGSVYIHKNRDGKLVAGPIWDFDWGTFSYNVSTWAQGRIYLTGTLWYGRMFGDPEFKALAKERWTEIYPKLIPISDYIEEQREYLAESAVTNFKLWNPSDTGNINGDETLSFESAVYRMKNIYRERIETLNTIISAW